MHRSSSQSEKPTDCVIVHRVTVAAARPRTCSVARTLEVVGEKWSLLAIREVSLGARRFEEMVANTGAPRDTLAARLKTLVEHGILEKRRYCERPPGTSTSSLRPDSTSTR